MRRFNYYLSINGRHDRHHFVSDRGQVDPTPVKKKFLNAFITEGVFNHLYMSLSTTVDDIL